MASSASMRSTSGRRSAAGRGGCARRARAAASELWACRNAPPAGVRKRLRGRRPAGPGGGARRGGWGGGGGGLSGAPGGGPGGGAPPARVGVGGASSCQDDPRCSFADVSRAREKERKPLTYDCCREG